MQKEQIILGLNEIKPYEKNARKNDDAVPSVMESIRQCGYVQNIVVDENNIILAGHTRWKALKKLVNEMPEYESIKVTQVTGLTEEQKRKYRLLDNKTNELAQWDFDLLPAELDGLDFGDLEFLFLIAENNTLEEEEEEKPEVEFAEVLGEEHNYIILYFDNEVDWLQAESLFEIKSVCCASTRKDRVLKPNMKRIGIGRVLKGAEAINKILGVKNENIS